MKFYLILILILPIYEYDFEFLFVQEHWIAKHSKYLEIAKPQLILNLGSPQYADREKAAQRLIEMGQAAWRPLVWATYSKDAEIANRGANLLGQLICHDCYGMRQKTGDISFGPNNIYADDPVTFPCPTCNGVGLVYKIKERLDNSTGWILRR